MANKMLIDATHPEETRVVVLRGNRVEEFDFESAHRRQLRGNIYLAKVTRVEPSLQAAFVDFGGNRHGFLAFSEIHPDYYQIPVDDRRRLREHEWRDSERHERRERADFGHEPQHDAAVEPPLDGPSPNGGHQNGDYGHADHGVGNQGQEDSAAGVSSDSSASDPNTDTSTGVVPYPFDASSETSEPGSREAAPSPFDPGPEDAVPPAVTRGEAAPATANEPSDAQISSMPAPFSAVSETDLPQPAGAAAAS